MIISRQFSFFSLLKFLKYKKRMELKEDKIIPDILFSFPYTGVFILCMNVYMQTLFYFYKKILQLYILKKIISSLPQEGTVSLF